MHDRGADHGFGFWGGGLMRLALIFALTAGPVFATQFDVPLACTSVVTVQNRDCTVSHFYRCPPEETDIFELSFNGDGAQFRTRYDRDGRALEYVDFEDSIAIAREPDATDTDSLSELLDTGEDTYDFLSRVSSGGQFRTIGFDRLLGQSVDVDGRQLQMTEFAYRLVSLNGETFSSVRGQQFVDPELRLYFGGIYVDTSDGSQETTNASPADFIWPGDDQFLSSKPVFDCDADT